MRLGNGIGRAGHSPWTPQWIGSSRFLWLRADSSDLTLSGAKVTAWADKGGGSYLQATDAKRPSQVTNSANGFDGVQFSGSMLLTRSGYSLTSGDMLYAAAINVPATSVNSFLYGTPTRTIADCDGNAGTQVGYYDGNWKKAGSAQTGLQILAWDLRSAGANIYRDNVVLSGGPLTYTPYGLTDPSIGFDSPLGTKSIVYEIVGVDIDGMSAVDIDALRTRLVRYMGGRYGRTVA